MADIFINELPLYTGNTEGVYLIINNSGETETFKTTRETLLGNLPDIYVTGGTYISGTSTLNLVRNDGDVISITGITASGGGTSGIDGTSGSSGFRYIRY
jgi:hypothetical protein